MILLASLRRALARRSPLVSLASGTSRTGLLYDSNPSLLLLPSSSFFRAPLPSVLLLPFLPLPLAVHLHDPPLLLLFFVVFLNFHVLRSTRTLRLQACSSLLPLVSSPCKPMYQSFPFLLFSPPSPLLPCLLSLSRPTFSSPSLFFFTLSFHLILLPFLLLLLLFLLLLGGAHRGRQVVRHQGRLCLWWS